MIEQNPTILVCLVLDILTALGMKNSK